LVFAELIKLYLKSILHFVNLQHILKTPQTQPVLFLIHTIGVLLLQSLEAFEGEPEEVNGVELFFLFAQLVAETDGVEFA
jgi:hypothetical protein